MKSSSAPRADHPARGREPNLCAVDKRRERSADGCDDPRALRLVPGDPLSALTRVANSLAGTDVVIISLDQTGDLLDQAWRYVPRMLHADSLVYLERPGKKPGETKFDVISPGQIAHWAHEAQRAMRRAA